MKPQELHPLIIGLIVLNLVSCGLLPVTQAPTPTTPAISSATHTPPPKAATQTYAPPTTIPPTTQAPLPAATDLPPSATIPPPSITPDPRMLLAQLIGEIHSQYEVDLSSCSITNSDPNTPPYEEARNEIITLLLSHPTALAFTLEERSAIYHEVTGIYHLEFVPGGGDAILVRSRSDCTMGRYQLVQAILIFDHGTIFDVGKPGLVYDIQWIDDRWVLLNRLKMDSTSGPTPWSIWHVENVGGSWQKVLDWSFDPTPYNFDGINLDFENGYQTMNAEVEYWYAEHPCEFSSDFTDAYQHGDWMVRNTYHLIGDQYELIDTQILDFPVTSLETNEPVSIDWQAYCISPGS